MDAAPKIATRPAAKTFLRAVLVSAVLIIATVVCLIRRSSEAGWSEPVYGGKPLTDWLAICHTGSPPARVEAEEAVRKIGTKAIPLLLEMLRTRDSDLKVRTLKFARQFAGQHQRATRIGEVAPATHANVYATHGFRVLGTNAAQAVPELIKIFDEKISPGSQAQTAVALLWIGPPARAAVPSLLRGATATNSGVRFNSIWALGDIHAEPKKVLPLLTNAFRDPDPKMRRQAIFSVVSFGTNARVMAPAISALLSDRDQKVRETARWALALPSLDPKPAGKEKQPRATNQSELR